MSYPTIATSITIQSSNSIISNKNNNFKSININTFSNDDNDNDNDNSYDSNKNIKSQNCQHHKMKNTTKTITTSSTTFINRTRYCTILLFNILLVLLLIIYQSTITVQYIFKQYWVPWMDEYLLWDDTKRYYLSTYYHRTCSEYDHNTTSSKNSLLHDYRTNLIVTDESDPNNQEEDYEEKFRYNINKYGVQLIPNLLSKETSSKLRDYILSKNIYYDDEKNKNASSTEKKDTIGVLENNNRYSFYVQMNDHPIIGQAMYELLSNKLLRKVLYYTFGNSRTDNEILVDDDDDNYTNYNMNNNFDIGIIELVALSSKIGAKDQQYHPDVLYHSSSTKYTNNFFQFYSLFVPLQNTTSTMGATSICPGTHFCSDFLQYSYIDNTTVSTILANNSSTTDSNKDTTTDPTLYYYYESNITQICIQASELYDDGIWKVGDGLLMNTEIIHRGRGQYDGIDRVLFIPSFAPKRLGGGGGGVQGVKEKMEHRTFPHGGVYGTYWSQWGLSYNDYLQWSSYYQSKFKSTMYEYINTMKSIGLIQANSWTYWDQISVRIANNEIGIVPSQFARYIHTILPYFPFSLWGNDTTHLYDKKNRIEREILLYFFYTTLTNIASTSLYLINILFIITIFLLIVQRPRPNTTNSDSNNNNIVTSNQDSSIHINAQQQQQQQQQPSPPLLMTSIRRIVIFYCKVKCIILLLFYCTLYSYSSSTWVNTIQSSRLLTSTKIDTLQKDDELIETEKRRQQQQQRQQAKETLPNIYDVLISDHIQLQYYGSYNDIINHNHPGNEYFFNSIVPYYSTNFINLSTSMKDTICNFIIQYDLQQSGRRLLIHTNDGNWAIPSYKTTLSSDDDDVDTTTRRFCYKVLTSYSLKKKSSSSYDGIIQSKIIQQLDFLLTETEHAYWRNTILHTKYIPQVLLSIQNKLIAYETTSGQYESTNNDQILWNNNRNKVKAYQSHRGYFHRQPKQQHVIHPFVHRYATTILSSSSGLTKTRKTILWEHGVSFSLRNAGFGHQLVQQKISNSYEPFDGAWLKKGDLVEHYNAELGCWYSGMITKASADHYEYQIVTKFEQFGHAPSKNLRRHQHYDVGERIEVLVVAAKAAIREINYMNSDSDYEEEEDDDEYNDAEEISKSGPYTTATVVGIESRRKVSVTVSGFDDIITVHIPDIRRGCSETAN